MKDGTEGKNPENLSEPEPGFEASMRAAEQSVAALESGTLDLDGALVTYERAVRLLERCHGLLDAAEQRVSVLVGTNPDGTSRTEPFNAPGE